uniref:Uncharacterized protein n=1 Tax=Rhizophora mucronata TaxID=61149 RepID=A0A2P2PPH7_RHIMU
MSCPSPIFSISFVVQLADSILTQINMNKEFKI